MMLRSVLEDYLNCIKEREFDLPFLALLPALGYFDIHFTHGQVEFGKDFIAKKNEDGEVVQYSFQAKAGDINQADWRNTIMGQMLESLLVGVGHPNFSRDLPHKSVLLTTGRLLGNVGVEIQDINKNKIVDIYKKLPIIVWDKEDILNKLMIYGVEEVFRSAGSNYESYGNFYKLYGSILRDELSLTKVEKHFQHWLDESFSLDDRILGCGLESEIIASQCIRFGRVYEAIHVYLNFLRVVLNVLDNATMEQEQNRFNLIYSQLMEKLIGLMENYIYHSHYEWVKNERNLAKIIRGPGVMFTYLVFSARLMEIAGFLYFAEKETGNKNQTLSILLDFVQNEPGCGRMPSDRYAISLVLPILALLDGDKSDDAKKLIRKAVVWLCDRYEEGSGLASVEARTFDEVATLFGYPFDFFELATTNDSFLATVLLDLAAFLRDREFYQDVVNDVKACKIFPVYWQIPDGKSLYFVEGTDIISYPNVHFRAESEGELSRYEYAEHIIHEPQTYNLIEIVGVVGVMGLMLLLRDRYFPKLWPLLAYLPLVATLNK
ncbi:MAG: hypothetical protein A2W35_13390 [Chloroflexi bacterium RBG_16_57_11]|nr:MAG: hypothetical protein A2W35_13390 [Chloroflexi bacterium RBG_16_57_11]